MIRLTVKDIATPNARIDDAETWAVIKGASEQELAAAFRWVRYRDYMWTPYWGAVSREVKRRAKYRCQLCGSGDRLQAHHREHPPLGTDHLHMDNLSCLCDYHHKMAHGLVKNPKKFKAKAAKAKGKKSWVKAREAQESKVRAANAMDHSVAWSSWRQLGRQSHGWRGSMR